MRSSRIMDAFCKGAARAEWTPQPTEPQKLKKKHRFSLPNRSTFGQPIALPDDVIPVANPRRLSKAPRPEDDYRRAQGEGPLSISKGQNNVPHAVPEPVYPLDQFAVNESRTASHRRRSWTLKPRNGAGPAKPALVTIAEFEEVNEDLKSGYMSYAASMAYTSPATSTAHNSPTPTMARTSERQHDTKPPLRSSPPPPKAEAGAPPIPKFPESTAAPAFNPHPGPNQYIQQSARRPQSQRIFRVNSRGNGPKRMSSKKQYLPREKVMSVGAARPKIVEIIPGGRRHSRLVRTSMPQELPAKTIAPPYELPSVSSPKEMCAAELPAVVVGGASPPQTPTLTFTAPTPTPTPAPEPIPQPTRKPPPPPITTTIVETTEKTAEKTLYKPYRAPTPEPTVEKALPIIPPLKTGWPAWKKEANVAVVEQKKREAAEKRQEVQGKDDEEVKKPVVIPEALRIGMGSLSLEARLGNWEALAGERY